MAINTTVYNNGVPQTQVAPGSQPLGPDGEPIPPQRGPNGQPLTGAAALLQYAQTLYQTDPQFRQELMSNDETGGPTGTPGAGGGPEGISWLQAIMPFAVVLSAGALLPLLAGGDAAVEAVADAAADGTVDTAAAAGAAPLASAGGGSIGDLIAGPGGADAVPEIGDSAAAGGESVVPTEAGSGLVNGASPEETAAALGGGGVGGSGSSIFGTKGLLPTLVGAGGTIVGSILQYNSASNAQNQSAAANAAALAFAKQQAEYQYETNEVTNLANYNENYAHEQNLSSLGELLGLPARNIPAFVPLPDPNYTGSGPTPLNAASLPAPGGPPATTPTLYSPKSAAPVNAPNSSAPASVGAASLPQFTSGMTPQQVQSLSNQYIAAGGVQNTDNGAYWVNAWNQWGSSDPAYFQTKLQAGVAGQPGYNGAFGASTAPAATPAAAASATPQSIGQMIMPLTPAAPAGAPAVSGVPVQSAPQVQSQTPYGQLQPLGSIGQLVGM